MHQTAKLSTEFSTIHLLKNTSYTNETYTQMKFNLPAMPCDPGCPVAPVPPLTPVAPVPPTAPGRPALPVEPVAPGKPNGIKTP